MRFFKVTLPITIAFVMAVVAIASIFISHHWSDNFIKETAYWSKVISGVTMFIGAFNLLRVHYNKVKRHQKGWGYSVLLFVFFVLMLTCGLLNRGPLVRGEIKALTETEAQTLEAKIRKYGGNPVVRALVWQDGQPLRDRNGNALFCLFEAGEDRERLMRNVVTPTGGPFKGPNGKPLYVRLSSGRVTEVLPIGFLGPLQPRTRMKDKDLATWLFEGVQRPASATQYSLLGFFICSAAYRTFRAKTPLAAVLLISALIVMLGQVPVSALLWDKIPVLSGWLLDIPNMAVKRAILFGICVGSVGTSLRVMFGIERSYMGGE